MLNQKELHEQVLYPVVRVRTPKAGGSGTIIYSKSNPLLPEEYQTFIITCSHVIEDAISTRKEWHPVLKKKVDMEFLEQVDVEVFDYVYLSRVNSSNSFKAEIVAYDKLRDIAILKLISPKVQSYVAKIIPKDKIASVKLFSPTYTAGCSLLHDPFANAGQITFLTEMIDNKPYWMSNGASIFGNSGGAVFLAETGEQVGLTARITVIPIGFSGVDIITWMGFSIAPQQIYDFIDEQDLKFFVDLTDTYEQSMKRRALKARRALVSKRDEEEEEGYSYTTPTKG